MPLFLALDQSTSATKALLFDEGGRTLDRESLEHRQHHPQPGWVEHDAEEIWTNTLATLKALLSRHVSRTSEFTSLSITNQRETVVVFDRATGQPLAPAIVWQCRRGEELCTAQAGQERIVQAATGLRIDPYFSASKLQWLVRNRPGLRAKLADGTALIGTIDTYLIYRLTGGRVFATDSTNASRTLLFDITRLCWDEPLCDLWEVPLRALPQVRESFAQFGETTLDGLLPRALPIRGVMGDSQASLFAQRCFAPGAAKVTFGTGSSLLLTIGGERRDPPAGILTALAWVRGGKPTYAFEGLIVSSASTLTWLRDELALTGDVPELERLASSVPDNGGVFLVPAYANSGRTDGKSLTRAAISGVDAHNDRRHLARAGFESIAYQIRDTLDAMRRGAGVHLTALHADGGPTASRFLMQFTADLVGVELRVPAVVNGSALGAVLAGQLGLGFYRSIQDISAAPHEETVYRPALPPERVASLYAGWQSAVHHAFAP